MRRLGLILLLAFGACDRAAAAIPVTPTIRLLELAGDMTLAPPERAQLVALQARERARDAAADARTDAELNGILGRYQRATPVQRAKMRHAIRASLHFNQAKMTDPLPARLLAAHDPVLVEDKPRHEVVTTADLRALDASNRYVARIAGTGVPDMTEKPGDRAQLQRRYQSDAMMRTVLTYAGPRHATMVAALDGLPAAKRAELDQTIRHYVHTPEDAANAARGMEQAIIVAQQRRALSARDSAALADFNRWIWQRNQVTLGMAKLSGMMRVLNTENLTYPR